VPERPQQPQRHCGHWIVIYFLAVPAMMSSWEGNAMESARRRHRQTGWPDWRPDHGVADRALFIVEVGSERNMSTIKACRLHCR
jgi:hypothetical protein